ncbi:hemoblobin-interacting domain-containing protein [Paenibacillus sp. 2TAB19]|uniref:hemoblobin-interacting domain-containing protein n=1 Tax=Paenibacillus sp. 2TAB19 TaxID=3233003 RepID=UPI003F95F19A
MAGADSITSATAAVSGDNTTVTVTFNTYATPTVSLVDLISNIEIERSGSDTAVSLLTDDADNEISIIEDEEEEVSRLVITLDTALEGASNAVTVKAGSVMNRDSVSSVADITVNNITAHDITPPAFVGAESSDGDDVYLKFDESFTINVPNGGNADTFLASRISISSEGGAFVPFTSQAGQAYQEDAAQIYLSYDNDVSIIAGPNTVIKIAAGTLIDEAGNLNAEMNVQVSPPVIESAEISSDNRDVTITFNKNVFDHTNNYLKNYIYLARNTNSNSEGLAEGDTVSIVANQLHIHFATALYGDSNQIIIQGNTLKDAYGNVQNSSRASALIQAHELEDDQTPPKLVNYLFTNSLHDLALIFDEEVTINEEDIAYFKQSVRLYLNYYGYYHGLPADATVTISGSVVNIHFPTLPAGSVSVFYFYGMNVMSDRAGNMYNGQIETQWVNVDDYIHPYINSGYFSKDGRFLSIDISTRSGELVDLTLDAQGSHLKDRITLSMDNGLTFSPLEADDVVTMAEDKIMIIFAERKTGGSIRVKIAANTVRDVHGYGDANIELNEAIAYNTPDMTGYFLSNAASEFVFEDNSDWRSNVGSVMIYDNNYDTYRQLNSSEYVLSEGKFIVKQGVFQEGSYYYIRINAAGYSEKELSGNSYRSSELFYITAPVVTATNGITATLNLLSNAYNDDTIGNQTIIFELFDGQTPVSIVAADLKIGTGTYSANFNVSDAATNSDYTVKAYVVSHYNNDPAYVGLNLATVKTQSEFELALIQAAENNYPN